MDTVINDGAPTAGYEAEDEDDEYYDDDEEEEGEEEGVINAATGKLTPTKRNKKGSHGMHYLDDQGA